MKKLMIALGAVACAISLQAATASWATSPVFAGADPAEGDNGVLFNWAIAELASSDVSGVSFANGVLTGATQVGDGGATTIYAWDSPDIIKGSLEGTAGKYYALCIWSGEFEQWGVSDAVLAKTDTTDATGSTLLAMAFSNLDGDPFAAGGKWTQDRTMSATQGAAPIPEPTSGLLLLLGVAGMALRRRRA